MKFISVLVTDTDWVFVNAEKINTFTQVELRDNRGISGGNHYTKIALDNNSSIVCKHTPKEILIKLEKAYSP